MNPEQPLTRRARLARFATDVGDAARASLHHRVLLGYALLFALGVLGMAWLTGRWDEWFGYYGVQVGLGSIVLAWFAWRGTRDPAAQAQAAAGTGPICRPALEAGLVLACILAFLLVRVDQLLHGPFTSALFALNPDPAWPTWAILGVKLILNVILPVLLFLALGYRPHELGLRWGAGWRLWPLLLLLAVPKMLGAVADPRGAVEGLATLLGSALYFFFAAGLPEEFTSRALLQTRLLAWWRSPTAAIAGQGVVFALVHVPIRLIGGYDPLFIAANLFLFVLALGLVFGLIYHRTQAVFPVAWLHALVDA